MGTLLTFKDGNHSLRVMLHHDFEYCEATMKDGIFARIALTSLDVNEYEAVVSLNAQLQPQWMVDGISHLIIAREDDQEIIGFMKSVNIIKTSKIVEDQEETFYECECLYKDVVWRTDGKRTDSTRKRKNNHI